MAQEKKVTQLDELTDPVGADLLYIVDDVAGTPTGKKITKLNLTGYTEYVALVSQVGTNAPTAVVIKNDTGATVTFEYNTTGTYKAVFSTGVLIANKSIAMISGASVGVVYRVNIVSTTEAFFYTANQSGTPQNSLLYGYPLIVRVYQ